MTRLALLTLLTACAPTRPDVPPPAPPTTTAPEPPAPVDLSQEPSPPEAPAAPTHAPDPRASETTSAHPGINSPYRAPNAATRWARSFERDGREVHDHRAQIVRALDLRPGMAVADVGAGTGLFTVIFAEAVGPSGTVYAVDLIPAFLAHIRTKVEKASLTQVRLVQASDRSAELPPASVDLIFMSDAYHHLEYPQHVLATLRQALRPGGSLWLIDFRRGPDSPAWLLQHVRAGKTEVLRELELAGFELVDEPPLLHENYILRLRVRPAS